LQVDIRNVSLLTK